MGIGSDMNAIDSHFAALDGFLAGNKIDDAKKERENMRFAFYTMLEQVNYKSLYFWLSYLFGRWYAGDG